MGNTVKSTYSSHYSIIEAGRVHELFIPYNIYISLNEDAGELIFEEDPNILEEILNDRAKSKGSFMQESFYSGILTTEVSFSDVKKIKHSCYKSNFKFIRKKMRKFQKLLEAKKQSYSGDEDDENWWKNEI